MILDGETILPDDYPVFCGYIYLCDGVPKESNIEGNILKLKYYTEAKEIRRCKIIERIKIQEKEVSL